jgi:hypothetical protein
MSADKLNLFHEEILQEEGVKVSELPNELQSKIKGFNLMKKKLEKNPDDERLFIQLQKTAVKLGDAVQNFIENDYEDEDEDEDDDEDDDSSKNKKPASKEGEKPASKKPQDDSSKEDEKPASRKPQDDSSKEGEKPVRTKNTNGSFGNSMMEKKIMSIMNERGEKRIKISDLESIIGKEPDYPEQAVNNIKLRKVFLSNDYRLV